MIEARVPEVGERLPPFSRRTGLEHWNRYAAVSGEFQATHMDDDAGREAGFPGAFGLGDLQVSYFHSLLRAWLGGRGQIRQMSCRFHAPNLKGMLVVAEATVVAVDGTGAELELRAHDGEGVVLATGSALVTCGR